MKKKEFIILGIVSLLLVLTGVFFIYFKKIPLVSKTANSIQNKDIIVRKTQNPIKIALLLENKAVEVGSIFEIEIILDTSKNNIHGADVVLIFDPQALQIIDTDSNKPDIQVSAGILFEKPMLLMDNADNSKGTVSLSIGTLTPFNGKGIYGIIKFKALKSTSTKIDFDQAKTKVAILDETTSYTGKQDLTPITIKIGD
ncbi:MAG: cohesin domain-containing protein [Patescibacteria group bacterium]|nr:cohesin domain-containing protein [Patescibacteria group bacterium]